MVNFKRLSHGVDVRPLVSALKREAHLFTQITARQSFEASPHKDTETIFLRWCPSQTLEAAFTELESVDYPALRPLKEFRSAIGNILGEAGGIKLGRAIVVKLNAHGKITEHADEGLYADCYERFHLVLESDFGTKFTCGGETVTMRPGEIWWFNHKLPHSVENNSDKPRTHFIVDMVAPLYRQERHAISA